MNYITNDDTIIFDSEFNEELDTELISGFKKLIFSDYELNERLFEHYANNNFCGLKYEINKFNQDVSVLPSSIIHLTFGTYFDQDVSVLPPFLTHLIFGFYFNRDVSNLPPTLTHLTFGFDFNQDVSNLPPTLTHLTFGGNFNQDISRLPPFLTHLTLGYGFIKECNVLPNIKYLKLSCNNIHIINSLPNSVAELELGKYFNLEINNLPTSIKKLVIDKDSYYNMDLNCLPDFIEELHLNYHYKKRILNIPSNLKKIVCYIIYPYKDDFLICDVEIYK